MTVTVSSYLLQRLKALGVDHLFGIPGDYILPLFESIAGSGVNHVAACNELNAGYAADGYARLRGLGAVAVTCSNTRSDASNFPGKRWCMAGMVR